MAKFKTQKNHSCHLGHLILKNNCPYCKSLQKEWYQALAKSGFEDLEDNIGLKDRHFNQTLERNIETFHERVSYYSWAQEKAQSGKFYSAKDKLIWEYHAKGWSQPQIAPVFGHSQSWICKKINFIKTHLMNQIESIGSMSYASA